MKIINAFDALENAKINNFRIWNNSESSQVQSKNTYDASNRIFKDFAILKPHFSGALLTPDSAVFTMGSCFAREIEAALIRKGCNIVSINDSIQVDAFKDDNGQIRTGFFHRFTPKSIWQEFAYAFDKINHWDENSLIFDEGRGVFDLNYWQIGNSDKSIQATLKRREIAKNLVKNAAQADVIILTLGLIEAWYHKSSSLYANSINSKILARHRDQFELHILDVKETINCLEEIYTLLKQVHINGDFRFVITVSPVPLTSTFTSKDVIIANSESKSILRAAASLFVDRYDNVDYFPSFEMVNYTNPTLAWRPDKVHVNPAMVTHIVENFYENYYQK